MAATPEKNPAAPEKVEADPQAMKNQEPIFRSWGERIQRDARPLVGATIAPGLFPDAEQFKFTVEKRVERLAVNAIQIGAALIDIADYLVLTADSYIAAEDRNKDEAVRAANLSNAVSEHLPGASSTVTPAPGMAPAPPAPADVPVPDEIAQKKPAA